MRQLERALDGIEGQTVVHMCFGYAYVVKEKPSGYSFLPELEACSATAISIEAAEPRLDPAILRELPSDGNHAEVSVRESPRVACIRARRAMVVCKGEPGGTCTYQIVSVAGFTPPEVWLPLFAFLLLLVVLLFWRTFGPFFRRP